MAMEQWAQLILAALGGGGLVAAIKATLDFVLKRQTAGAKSGELLADRQTVRITVLEANVDKLYQQNVNCREESAGLRAEVAILRADLLEAHKECEQLRTELTQVKLSVTHIEAGNVVGHITCDSQGIIPSGIREP
jgi:alkylation response protein AidB-like acyl-CoA dehydrogenase